MIKPRLNNPLRNLGLLAIAASLAWGTGCSGDFTRGDGHVQNRLSEAVSGQTGVQALALTSVPVEVDVHEGSIIFDFSNVEEPGVLSTLETGGYLLDGSDTTSVWGVRIDSEHSNADPAALIVQFDRNGVTVNFDDLEYDSNTFIKIDVRLADADS